jgi:nitrite reductase (cytochrome c-552)
VPLFAGYPFSEDYNEERGHRMSLVDVRETLRSGERTPATCYSCKSATNPRLWAEMGMDLLCHLLRRDDPAITEPIGCANCHEANTMRLIVTNPALEEALRPRAKTGAPSPARRCARWCAPTATSNTTSRARAST